MAAHGLFISLCVRNASDAIRFYTRALPVQERLRLTDPRGRVGHAELEGDGFVLTLSDEYPEFGLQAPPADSHASAMLRLYVDDADAAIARMIRAGASMASPARDRFCGERSGSVLDPFGYRWVIAQRQTALSREEIERRYAERFATGTVRA